MREIPKVELGARKDHRARPIQEPPTAVTSGFGHKLAWTSQVRAQSSLAGKPDGTLVDLAAFRGF